MLHLLLKDRNVVLASESPRRKSIFKMIGINALQMPAKIQEPIENIAPHQYVMKYARLKAEAVRANLDADCFIVAADTIVYAEHQILGKPEDVFKAADYLTFLSDARHYVYTGVCIAYKNRFHCDYEKTAVEFKSLSPLEIEEYIRTGEPMDKAGAYGIQGYGSQFIRKVQGCYFNVMGFPISCFYELVKKIG